MNLQQDNVRNNVSKTEAKLTTKNEYMYTMFLHFLISIFYTRVYFICLSLMQYPLLVVYLTYPYICLVLFECLFWKDTPNGLPVLIWYLVYNVPNDVIFF